MKKIKDIKLRVPEEYLEPIKNMQKKGNECESACYITA